MASGVYSTYLAQMLSCTLRSILLYLARNLNVRNQSGLTGIVHSE